MFYSDIFDSESRQLEPASRYNAVNMLLRSDPVCVVESAVENSSMTVVQCFNDSETEISRFHPVSITGVHESDLLSAAGERPAGRAAVCGIPAMDDSYPWAVALENIVPRGWGEAAVGGCVPAFFSGDGDYVTPWRQGFNAGSYGNARILVRGGTAVDGSVLPGLLLLGYASAPKEGEYYGMFKLGAISANQVEIYNSFGADSTFCGMTDVPGLTYIPRTVLTFEDIGEKQIYLVFFYDPETGSYRSEFLTSIPEDAVFFKLIGRFQNGVVSQIYRESRNQMNFGEEWYLR